jgi:hypothetical protein
MIYGELSVFRPTSLQKCMKRLPKEVFEDFLKTSKNLLFFFPLGKIVFQFYISKILYWVL